MVEKGDSIPRITITPTPLKPGSGVTPRPRGAEAKTIPIPGRGAPRKQQQVNTEHRPPDPPLSSRYTIIEKIGDGGMGVVYLARDLQLGRYVAIKRLNKESLASSSLKQRFFREAKAIAALNHIHIVHVYALGEDREGPYIVMEYISGPKESSPNRTPPSPFTLADKVHRDGPMNVNEALDLVLKLANAVQYGHSCGVIHRDLKPSNVLLDESSQPKIVDFGLARTMNNPAENKLTVPGEKMLSLGYGAPEQESDASLSDERADVYGLGALLYFSLTGQNPRYFREKDVPEAMRIPIVRALETDREKRWQTVEAFAEALMLVKAPTKIDIPTTRTTWRCKWCDTVNPVMIHFCATCGWDGGETCAECGAETRFGIQFCGSCGADAREYEAARALRQSLRAAMEEHDYAYVSQHAGQISGFSPVGPNGHRMIEDVKNLMARTEDILKRRAQLRELIQREMSSEAYEQAHKHILEYHATSREQQYEKELAAIPERIRERDRRRAQKAFAAGDWAYAEMVCQGLLSGPAPHDEVAEDVLGRIKRRRGQARRWRVTGGASLALVLYILSAAPVYCLMGIDPAIEIPRIYKPVAFVYRFTILERPLRTYASLWGLPRLFAPPPLPIPDDITPPPPPPAAQNLAQLTAKYEQTVAALDTTQAERMQAWAKGYVTELKALQDRMQKAGDYEGWSTVTQALEEFQEDMGIPETAEPVAPHELASLQEHYRAKEDGLLMAHDREFVKTTQAHIRKLEGLQKTLTRAGEMEAASLVNAEIKRLKTSERMSEAEARIAPPADPNNG